MRAVSDHFTVIVPAHNEAEVLEGNILRLRDYVKQISPESEILICENGSTDGTPEIAEALARRHGDIRLLSLPHPSLPEALKRGIESAHFERIIYLPADLSVNLSFIKESLGLLDEYDIIVGSKRMRGAIDDRPLERRLLSRGYHLLVRLLFKMNLTDTTCVKAFRRNKVIGLLHRVPTSSSVFETRLLTEALREGLRVKEIPVVVRDQRRSRGLPRRVIKAFLDLISSKFHSLPLDL